MTEIPLKQRATQAFFWDVLGIFSRQGVAFVVSVFLARLLTPADFGVMAMALVFISVTQVFADFGLASALIQRQKTTSLTYSSVFYLNVVVGLFLFAFFFAAAPFIGAFYGQPDITDLVRWLSVNFVLSSFNQVQQTILRKNIDFKKITLRNLVAQTASGIAAIYLAFAGWGVYALVVQNLLGTLVGTFLLWRVAEWKPRWEFSWKEVKELTGFSAYVFLSNVTAKLAGQLDTLVVGKVFNANMLGLYSRATSLNSLVTTFSSASISKISFSLLSKIQDDRGRLVQAYFRLLSIVAFGSFGLSGVLLFAGGDLIQVLFGPQWTSAILIFQILVLKAFTYPVSLLIVSVFWAVGKSKESFWYGNVSKVLALLPLLVAVQWGFRPFLYAVVVAALVSWLLTNWFVARSLSISFAKQCKVVGTYCLLFTLIALTIYLVVRWTGWSFPYAGTIAGVIYGAVYLGLNLVIATEGYRYSVEYLTPLILQIRKRFS